MPNSTRRRVGHRAASPANMHENTRSRTATASGGTPSLAREEADDEAAALIRQADGDTTGAAGILRTRGDAVPGLVDEATDHRKLANVIRLRLVFLGATQPQSSR